MGQYELNILDYWLIIKKRKFLILATAILVVLFTLGLTQAIKEDPRYQASASVKFDRTSTIADLLTQSVTSSWGNEWSTQSEVIRSLPVMEEAARTLGLLPLNATPEQQRSQEYLAVIYGLQAKVTAEPDRKAAIIRILTTSSNPEMARDIANATAEAYREENIRSRNRMVTESLRFVESQLAARERKLHEAEEALRNFKEREGQVFLTLEAKAALSAFTKLEQDYDRAVRIKRQTAKQVEILKREKLLPEGGIERIFIEDPSTLLSSLNHRLVELLQERSTLLINYTPEHPQVQLVDRKTRNVKLEMIRELVSKLKSLSAREDHLKEQIDQYKKRYLDFPEAAIQLSRLEREVQVNADLYSKLKTKQQELLIKSAERIEEVTILAPAVAPKVPINAPKNQMNMIVGSIMGLFLGIVLAFARESFDTSIATIEGIEEFLKVPVLGVIPQFDEKEQKDVAAKALPPETDEQVVEMFARLPCLVNPTSMLSENLRSLRTNIQFAHLDQRMKSIVFTSVGLGEGKSTTVINLAMNLAQEGQRVLLIDGDLRKPIIQKRLGLPKEPGLAEALMGTTAWRTSVRTVTDLMLGGMGVDLVMNTPGLDNLNVLTSGTASRNPAEFLTLEKFGSLISEMQAEYDMLLFDTPPILPVTDAVTMSSRADGTVLVYQVGRIGRSALKRAKFLLDHAKANVLGVVLTNVNAEVAPEYSYMEYQYR